VGATDHNLTMPIGQRVMSCEVVISGTHTFLNTAGAGFTCHGTVGISESYSTEIPSRSGIAACTPHPPKLSDTAKTTSFVPF
jgi:hypothetical protein